MSQPFSRQTQKPKKKSDNGIYGASNKKSSFLLTEEDDDFQIKNLQILSPKLKPELSTLNAFSDDISTPTTQSPENVSDCEDEDFQCSHHIKLQIEKMKTENQLKESQPLSNKGDPLSPMLKNQAKMAKMHPFRNLIFNPNCKKEVFQEHLKKVHNSLVYGIHHLKKPSDAKLRTKFITLTEQREKNQKTLLLDLDETLIHSCPLSENPKYIVDKDIFQGEDSFGFNIRPYCLEFLQIISKYYEVLIFTASSDIYANFIIDVLDPQSKYIKGILFRNHCLVTKKGIYIKDLDIINNRELRNMVIVDNNAHSFALQLDNGIPILEWKDDRNDRELKYILHYLLELAGSDDVRTFNRKFLKLEELSNVQDMDNFHNY